MPTAPRLSRRGAGVLPETNVSRSPASLAPARRSCRAGHLRAAGTPEQIKTWNLSSLWRIPLSPEQPAQGAAWLEVVPPFFAHEGALIAALEPHGGLPHVLGFERGRSLLAEIPGNDGFHSRFLDELDTRWQRLTECG